MLATNIHTESCFVSTSWNLGEVLNHRDMNQSKASYKARGSRAS